MVRVEKDGAVGIWTIARPQAKNALSYQTMEELRKAIQQASQDPTLRAVVLTGEGGTFVSGGDLRELRNATSVADAERVADLGRELCFGIQHLKVPVIAAVGGPAIGGGAELAVACDLRVADDRARFCFKQTRMGVTSAWGTLPKLLAMVGPSTAARLFYTGHEIKAMESRALGLVDYVAEGDGAVVMALAWAMDIAQAAPLAIAEMKSLFREAAQISDYLGARERERFVRTWTSADHREAVEAFFASRAPVWRGN